MESVDLGAAVTVAFTFQDPMTGTYVDPTSVFFTYSYGAPGAETEVTLTYGTDAGLIKDSTGHYRVILDASLSPQIWNVRPYSTGTYQAAKKDQFYVIPPVTITP